MVFFDPVLTVFVRYSFRSFLGIDKSKISKFWPFVKCSLVIVGTFDTEKEALACEENNKGRLALIDAINTCSDYDGLSSDEFISFFLKDDKAQTVVNYLQQLIDRGVKWN